MQRRPGLGIAIGIVLVTALLVALDLVSGPTRRWWADHAFTTSIVGGLLVLAVTVLVVDQTLRSREIHSRAQATAAQAAILLNQATRTASAIATISDASSRDAASDEARTYMTMVLIGAPILINEPAPRAVLEQSQWLGVLFSRALNAGDGRPDPSSITEALEVLRTTAAPLVRLLSHSERQAVGASDPA
jgi:phage gp46-like protein